MSTICLLLNTVFEAVLRVSLLQEHYPITALVGEDGVFMGCGDGWALTLKELVISY